MLLTVKRKLLIVTVPIILALLYFSGVQIHQAYTSRSSANTIATFVELSTHNSRLVYELQAEREVVAGLLGSERDNFTGQLAEQRQKTDKHIQTLISYMQHHRDVLQAYPDLWRVMDLATKQFQNIDTLRSEVLNQSIPFSKALNYYSKLNEYLLAAPALAVKVSREAEVSRALMAYDLFLQGLERAGIERTLLHHAFEQGRFGAGEYRKFSSLVSEQESYFSTFILYSDNKVVSHYQDRMASLAIKEVENYRKKTFTGFMRQDAHEWLTVSSKRIDLLYLTEAELREDILALEHAIAAEHNRSFWGSLVLSVLVISLSVYVCYRLLSGINRQVSYLNRTMGNAADKNLQVRCQAIAQDELGSISVNLNTMLDELTDAVSIIADASEQLFSAAEQSTKTVEQNANNLHRQQGDVDQIVTAVKQMNASVKEVTRSIRNTSEQADSANQQVLGSERLVQTSMDSIEEVQNRIESVSHTIYSLHQSTDNISGVVDVIQDIAEQTNLLALNAAIESARAGQHGRGFAVVASEVRSLAQRTYESTREIESMVAKLQKDSNSTFEQINGAREHVAISVEKAVNVKEALSTMTESINTIRDNATQIASAAEQQVQVSEDIASRAQTIGAGVRHAARSGEQMAEAARAQARLSEKLKYLVSQFKIISD
ncbi:methyl-accepting chemotaxis protein [Vibrio albus]|nr:methyl-accepting chemotaxis protein [Vibrio albus]